MKLSVLEARRAEVFQDTQNQVVIEQYYQKVCLCDRLEHFEIVIYCRYTRFDDEAF